MNADAATMIDARTALKRLLKDYSAEVTTPDRKSLDAAAVKQLAEGGEPGATAVLSLSFNQGDATDSSTTAATDSTTGSTTDATTTGGLQCEVDPNADACQMCMAANCCDEITACADDEDCTCFTNCIGEGTPPQQCVQMCMVNPMQNQALQDLRTCNLDNCADECG